MQKRNCYLKRGERAIYGEKGTKLRVNKPSKIETDVSMERRRRGKRSWRNYKARRIVNGRHLPLNFLTWLILHVARRNKGGTRRRKLEEKEDGWERAESREGGVHLLFIGSPQPWHVVEQVSNTFAGREEPANSSANFNYTDFFYLARSLAPSFSNRIISIENPLTFYWFSLHHLFFN